MERDINGQQFTREELKFIRYCMDWIIWSMVRDEIYDNGEIIHIRRDAKYILKEIDKMLKNKN